MTKIFNLLIVVLINTVLFVRIEQKSQREVRKQPFKCVSLKKVSIEKNSKVGKILEKQL